MNELTRPLNEFFDAAREASADFTMLWLPLQLGMLVVAGLIATGGAVLIRRRIDFIAVMLSWPPNLRLVAQALSNNVATIIFIALVVLMRSAMLAATWPSRSYLLGVAASLATAWVAIAVLTSLIRNQFVNRIVALAAWSLVALSILGLLEPTAQTLNSVGIMLGGIRLTPLLLLKASALLLIALWLATSASNFFERQLNGYADLTPSIQVLLGKLIRLSLIALAFVLALSSVGIDLSALALFSGAVGVGIGFGLQKIVSNLVSGIILLADKSIKPGDVISVGEHFGRVGNMGARYTSVDTRDGREYLIPNEDFITQRVANWTYSSDLVRLSVTFNTTYESDPRKVQEAAAEAALGIERVSRKPAPSCMLSGFGTAALEFEMWFWIRDPAAGVANVKSDVLLALWDALDKQGAKLAKPGPARIIYEMAGEKSPPDGSPFS